MKLKNIPCWLKNGNVYEELLEGGDSKIPKEFKNKIIDSSKINSIEDFKKIYDYSHFWMLKRLPFDIYVYGFLNKKEVLKFLKELGTSKSEVLYEDIKNDFSLIKYKNIISEDFDFTGLEKFYKTLEEKVILEIENREGEKLNYNEKDKNEDSFGCNCTFNFFNDNKFSTSAMFYLSYESFNDKNIKNFKKFLYKNHDDKFFFEHDDQDLISYIGIIKGKENKIIFNSQSDNYNDKFEFRVKNTDSLISELEKMYKFIKINKID